MMKVTATMINRKKEKKRNLSYITGIVLNTSLLFNKTVQLVFRVCNFLTHYLYAGGLKDTQ